MGQSNYARRRETEISYYVSSRFHYREKLLFFFFINLLALSEEIVKSSHSLFLPFPLSLSLPFFSPPYPRSLDTRAETLPRHSTPSRASLEPLQHPLAAFEALHLRHYTRIPEVPVTTSHFRGGRSLSNEIENVASRHFSSSTFARLRGGKRGCLPHPPKINEEFTPARSYHLKMILIDCFEIFLHIQKEGTLRDVYSQNPIKKIP